MTDRPVSLGELMAQQLGEIKTRIQNTEGCPGEVLCGRPRNKEKKK